MNLEMLAGDWLWRNALGAIPLAILAALIGRFVPCRASTRHAMWLLVLVWLLMPPVLPSANLAGAWRDWFSARPAGGSPTDVVQPVAAQPRPSPMVAAVPRAAEPAPATMGWHPPPVDVEPAPAPLQAPGLEQEFSAQWLASLPRPLSAPPREPAAVPFELAADLAGEPSPSPPPIAADAASSAGAVAGELSRWLSQFAALRDAVVALTPIPTSLWVVGSLLILAIGLTRIIRFRRQLRTAKPAPREVVREVRRAARRIGLATIPQTILLRRRIAPSVWCGGGRTLLILPEQLWNELDEPGREAVLLHELAHLKRRDHWVCWAELLASCVYWWHPLLWWVRKRLRDEADFCCDAWVTALLPTDRRAYARALLATRQFADEARMAVPAVGLGATTIRAKRFARRLTMVMTQSNKPRISAGGTILAAFLAAGAWLASPLWACPPDECKDKAKQEAKAAGKAAGKAVIVAAPKPPKAPKAPKAAAAPDASTFERHMAARERELALAGEGPSPHPAPRVHAPGHGGDLEARINQLEQRLNRLAEQIEQLVGERSGGGGARQPQMRAPVARPAMPAQPGMRAPRGEGFSFNEEDGGQTIIRLYRLPKGKLEPLVALMSRSDVPTLIAAQADGIEVHGSPREHEIFAAFVRLINPDGVDGAAALDYERALRERVTLIEGASADARFFGATGRARLAQEALKEYARQREQLHHQQTHVHQHSEAIRRAAEEMYRRAAELESQAEQMQEQADEVEGESRSQLLQQAHALLSQANALEHQADSQHHQAEAMLEQLEEALEQLEEAAAEAEEEVAEAEEEAAEAEEEAAEAEEEASEDEEDDADEAEETEPVEDEDRG